MSEPPFRAAPAVSVTQTPMFGRLHDVRRSERGGAARLGQTGLEISGDAVRSLVRMTSPTQHLLPVVALKSLDSLSETKCNVTG